MPVDGRGVQAVTVVVGANAVGSAIAHRLHAAGHAVVLLDAVDPPWTRRGRSYTDAWYYGTAQLAGTPAVFCASVRSIPSALMDGRAIAATTWSTAGVATALRPVAVVDARRGEPGAAPAGEVTVRAVADGEAAGDAWRIDVTASRASFVVPAPEDGHFRTHLAIGAAVRAGEPLGAVGAHAVAAGASGRLLGLSARGARVVRGGAIAEIDDAIDSAACFGLEPAARDAAERVLAGLHARYRF